jgi:hypothetical protein
VIATVVPTTTRSPGLSSDGNSTEKHKGKSDIKTDIKPDNKHIEHHSSNIYDSDKDIIPISVHTKTTISSSNSHMNPCEYTNKTKSNEQTTVKKNARTIVQLALILSSNFGLLIKQTFFIAILTKQHTKKKSTINIFYSFCANFFFIKLIVNKDMEFMVDGRVF